VLSDKDFDAIFDSWHQYGSEKQWRVFLPHLTPAELQEARQRCEEIGGAAFYLAEDVIAGKISEETGLETLARDYPNLSEDRLKRAWWNGLHSARK
jgi:hypothetical protein